MKFSDMTVEQQREYQLGMAQDIQRRITAGDGTLTQAEIDFAGRILGKKLATVPNQSVLELVGESIGDGLRATGSTIGDSIRNATGGWLWPLAIIAAVMAAFWFFGARGGK